MDTLENKEIVKKYMSEKRIAELFQALTVGIVYNKPKDHIDFLLKCLEKLKAEGKENEVIWDTFLPTNTGPERKSPLQEVLLSSLSTAT